MFPVIARVGGFTLYSYGLFVLAAFFLGIYWATRRAARAGFPPFSFFEMGVYGGMASILGSRILYVLSHWPYYVWHPAEVVRLWDGGFIFFGGYIGSLIFILIFLYASRLPIWRSLDIYAPALPLGLAIGRVGCFFNGCCYGLRSDAWGISFPADYHPPIFLDQVRSGLIPADSLHTLPVIPTQLYSAAADLGIMAVLLLLERKKRFPGFLFWSFIFLYGIVRAILEIFRWQDPQEAISAFSPLSQSQVFSLFSLPLALIMLLVLRMWSSRHPEAEPPVKSPDGLAAK